MHTELVKPDTNKVDHFEYAFSSNYPVTRWMILNFVCQPVANLNNTVLKRERR